jgi:hypothetical protein
MRAFLILLAFVASAAHAELIRVEFIGNVSVLRYAACQGYSDTGNCNSWTNTPLAVTDLWGHASIELGDVMSGSFVYDPLAPQFGISDDGYQATHLNGVPEAAFSAGSLVLPSSWLPLSWSHGAFAIIDGRYGRDSFYLDRWFSSTDWFATMRLSLQDTTQSIFDGFAVPTDLRFEDFDAHVFSIGFIRRADGDQIHLQGTLTSATFSRVAVGVPTPGAASLMLGMISILVLFRRVSAHGQSI